MRPFLFLLAKNPPRRDVRTRLGFRYVIRTSVRSSLHVFVCVGYIITTPISTNPASPKAGELSLTRGACFVASRLDFGSEVAVLLCV